MAVFVPMLLLCDGPGFLFPATPAVELFFDIIIAHVFPIVPALPLDVRANGASRNLDALRFAGRAHR